MVDGFEWRRHHARAHRFADEHRRGQHARATGGCERVAHQLDDFAGFEAQGSAGSADGEQLCFNLENIAASHGRQKLHRLVCTKETLVAVVTNQKLGGDITEELQAPRPIDEVARVVYFVLPNAYSMDDFHGDAL
jgi:hypothetical protein